MELFYGIAMVCGAVLLFGELMLATRKPVQPGWTGGFILTSIYVIIVISLPMIGISLIVNAYQSLSAQGIDLVAVMLSLLVMAASLLRITLVRRRIRRLKSDASEKVEPLGEKIAALPADSYRGRQAA
jgi:uncharacterized membrane protein YcjF (UPF0283 family)